MTCLVNKKGRRAGVAEELKSRISPVFDLHPLEVCVINMTKSEANQARVYMHFLFEDSGVVVTTRYLVDTGCLYVARLI